MICIEVDVAIFFFKLILDAFFQQTLFNHQGLGLFNHAFSHPEKPPLFFGAGVCSIENHQRLEHVFFFLRQTDPFSWSVF